MTPPRLIALLLLLAISPAASVGWAAQAPGAPTIAAPDILVAGDPLAWTLEGLAPNQMVRVHSVARFPKFEPGPDGKFVPHDKIVHAWADFRADAQGRIDGAHAAPLAGTYAHPDGLGLIWSGYVAGDPALPTKLPARLYDLPGGYSKTLLKVEVDGAIVAEKTVEVRQGRPDTLIEAVRNKEVTGWLARPPGPGRRPAVIVLHGSEGGGAMSRGRALDLAAQGFVTLAVDYFADRAERLPLPPDLREIPIEVVDRAHAWLARRPEVDPNRIAVVGTSRGAELALLVGATFHWPAAIVGCAAGDLVRAADEFHVPGSTIVNAPAWTYRGRPIAFVPDEPEPFRRYPSRTAAYRAAEVDFAPRLAAARIRVERIKAPLLVLGSEADTIWHSAEMVRRILGRRSEAGLSSKTVGAVYPNAGHQICGDGTWPLRLYGSDGVGDRNLSMEAEGEAAVQAWNRTLAFLRETMK